MNHKKLDVWNLGIGIVKDVYSITNSFPKSEIYGLTSQLRRCSVSIPSNIAEGAARSSIKDYLKFLFIARGSLSEMDTQLIIAKELGFLSGDTSALGEKINELTNKLNALITSLKRRL